MVSEQEARPINNSKTCYADGTDYDNLELIISSASSVAMLKNGDSGDDPDTETLEKLPYVLLDHGHTGMEIPTECRNPHVIAHSSYRSATATPTCSTLTQEPSSNGAIAGYDSGRASIEPPTRPPRAYRIIDSSISQKILQQLEADKLAAAHAAGKGTKFLKRKGSSKGTAAFFVQRQPSCMSQIWCKSDELSSSTTSSKEPPRLRSHFDVVRTSSFGGNPSQLIRKHLDCNRNSLPLSIITLSLEESETPKTTTPGATVVQQQDPVSRKQQQQSCSTSVLQKMAAALDGAPQRPAHRHTSSSSALSTSSAPISDHQQYANGVTAVSTTDDDSEAVQRLSFVSSSTGYSSARSSLRSSEISDDSNQPFSAPVVGKKLLTQESSLSEVRRLKLVSSGTATQLDRIAIELLETERSYVNDINDVIQGYLNFLVDHRDEFEMTVDDISNTFGCIERIFLFNKKLYHELDAAQLNIVSMARCFSENVDGFNDYVTYCTKYQVMVETLSELMKNKKIAEILRIRQNMLGHSLPLSAYLLKPVQRVLKYHLFLENILKNPTATKTLSDGDRAVIRHALQCMTAQAEKINDEKKRVEHLERVRELQSALHKWCIDEREDLSKYGDLLLEATFKLAGAKTNRQLFLFEEMLLIVKERNGALICKDYIMCSSLMLNESVSNDPLAFQVLSYDNPKIQYIFLASNMDQKRHWMKELKRMMLDHYTVQIPEKTKMLMLNMDDDCTKSISSFSQQGASTNLKANKKVPKYLEKRRKSIDANHTFRRSHARKRNSSGGSSRSVLKASSTGNLVRELEMFQEADAALKDVASHSCSFTSNSKPSTSTVSTGSACELQCASEVPGHSAAVFQNLFSRKKTNDANRKKSTGERKNSFVSHLPPSIFAKEHLAAKNNTLDNSAPPPSLSNSASNKHTERCHCAAAEPTTVGTSSMQCSTSQQSKSNHLNAQKHFDDTMAVLYRELQLLMKNAENFSKIGVNKDRVDHGDVTGERTNSERQREAVQRLDALVGGRKGLNDGSLTEDSKKRSRSLSKFDDESTVTLVFGEEEKQQPRVADNENMSENKLQLLADDDSRSNFKCETADSDSSAFLKSSTFGMTAFKCCATSINDGCHVSEELEEDDEPASVISWTESPHNSEKFHAVSHNIHHRRRSSQVAEQVWRLRQKQALTRKDTGENATDKKLLGVALTATETGESLVVRENILATRMPKPSHNSRGMTHREVAELGRRRSTGALLARQRTPLTVEQCAELDDDDNALDPNLGVVRKMIRQLERPQLCIISQQHAI